MDGHKERMNFFAWTINYALIPAPSAASLHDASSILTFALLPFHPHLPLPLPIVPAREPPRNVPYTRAQTCACTHLLLLPHMHHTHTQYIYIRLSLLAGCSPVYGETARYLRERGREARRWGGVGGEKAEKEEKTGGERRKRRIGESEGEEREREG